MEDIYIYPPFTIPFPVTLITEAPASLLPMKAYASVPVVVIELAGGRVGAGVGVYVFCPANVPRLGNWAALSTPHAFWALFWIPILYYW